MTTHDTGHTCAVTCGREHPAVVNTTWRSEEVDPAQRRSGRASMHGHPTVVPTTPEWRAG